MRWPASTVAPIKPSRTGVSKVLKFTSASPVVTGSPRVQISLR